MRLNMIEQDYKKTQSQILDAIANDDSDITYQEYVLGVSLVGLAKFVFDVITPDDSFDPNVGVSTSTNPKINMYIEGWMKLTASKTHPVEITIPWDEVFDRRIERLKSQGKYVERYSYWKEHGYIK